MIGTLNHNGYAGSVEFSEEDGLLHGKLIGIRDAVTYEGKDVKSLTRNFRQTIEEYRAFCAAEGKERISLSRDLSTSVSRRSYIARLPPGRSREQTSLNAVIRDALESACR